MSEPPSRWFAVGSAEEPSPEAGARGDAKLLVVFCSQSHDLPALVGRIGDRSGGVPLIGCTTAGDPVVGWIATVGC
jgi:hypothetical protein